MEGPSACCLYWALPRLSILFYFIFSIYFTLLFFPLAAAGLRDLSSPTRG